MARQKRLYELIADECGAVAATYALALIGLIAVAGVAFDYARLATMDSELQNAADQAALAAATQLDGTSNAITNATSAASNLVSNTTLLANDGSGPTVTIDTLTFYSAYSDGSGTVTTDPTEAHYVNVKVGSRKAFYAFTPIVGLLSSRDIAAHATAGLGSAICKVPPVFMCNPDEPANPTGETAFDVTSLVGHGIRLIANDGGSSYAPGQFGYLEASSGAGASNLAKALGLVNTLDDCSPADGVTTEPGVTVSVLDYLNTRLDVYANGMNPCGTDGSNCPPSDNSRKDLMQEGAGCAYKTGGGTGWHIAPHPYHPTSATTALTNAEADVLSPMGYPRDMCHAVSVTGACTDGQVGDGIWDRNAYLRSNKKNYPSYYAGTATIAGIFGTATPTRYQVYKYEADNAGTRLQDDSDSGLYSRPTPVCTTPGIPVGGGQVDRRVLTVAVINCNNQLKGGKSTDVHVADWIDVFLVEPAVARTDPITGTKMTENSDVYVEVIGGSPAGGGAVTTTPQFVRRDKPYLLD